MWRSLFAFETSVTKMEQNSIWIALSIVYCAFDRHIPGEFIVSSVKTNIFPNEIDISIRFDEIHRIWAKSIGDEGPSAAFYHLLSTIKVTFLCFFGCLGCHVKFWICFTCTRASMMSDDDNADDHRSDENASFRFRFTAHKCKNDYDFVMLEMYRHHSDLQTLCASAYAELRLS